MASISRTGTGLPVVLTGLALLILSLALLISAGAAAAPPATQRIALVLTIEGAIGPATADYIERGFERAVQREAAVVVLQIDTPGGLDSSMRDINRRILNAPVPVLSWVGPSGARAASAGTYILYASHVAAMAPGTNLGAATPVSIGAPGTDAPDRDRDRDRERDRDLARDRDRDRDAGAHKGDEAADGKQAAPDDASRRRPPASTMEAKATNDAVAYIRSLAELRGRNADWAESAVRDAASLSSRTAHERKVIDLVVPDIAALLEQANGRSIVLGQDKLVLDTGKLVPEVFDPDWRTRMLGVITNPNVALILMMIGFYGLVFEFMNPGSLLPGTIGAISLLVGLYALAALPINVAGLALILLGVVLMIAEIFTPSVVLGVGGVVAFALGATILVDTDAAPGFDVSLPLIAGVAVVGLGFMLLVARSALRSRRGRALTGGSGMVGARARVLDWSGNSGHVMAHGERWSARADKPLVPGTSATIVGIDGLTVVLRTDPDDSH